MCEAIVSGDARCLMPLLIRGIMVDTSDGVAIEGALVQAVDANGSAVGPSTPTDADGTFTRTVPAVRDEDGEGTRSMAHTLCALRRRVTRSFRPQSVRLCRSMPTRRRWGGRVQGDRRKAAINVGLRIAIREFPLQGSDEDDSLLYASGKASGVVEKTSPQARLWLTPAFPLSSGAPWGTLDSGKRRISISLSHARVRPRTHGTITESRKDDGQ